MLASSANICSGGGGGHLDGNNVLTSACWPSCRFILSALSASQRNVVNCALCHRALPVFEQFPLVDGTLFLSPSRHDEIEYDVPCHLQGQTQIPSTTVC